ncbi:MAG: flagellar basal body-associated FliL family protein [Pseudomonadota bacterium]
MAKLVLPLILALAGVGAGVGAGAYFKPAPEEEKDARAEPALADKDMALDPQTEPTPDRDRPPLEERDFVRINNQFVVPVLEDGRVTALVVLSISLETHVGMRQVVFAREPKLRDALLQVMFDHANAGGFSGNFTRADRIEILRRNLWEAARPVLGPDVYDVLITDIARQDG